MYVVADLDDYLADPEAYLKKNPLKIADELLKYDRPRRDWKYAELEPLVKGMHGRSFENGKHLFTVANCIACHKLNGVGTAVGPDLSQLDPKKQPVDVLKDVLEPSFRINEKFQTYLFTLDNGLQKIGLIVGETPTEVKLMENPLAKCGRRSCRNRRSPSASSIPSRSCPRACSRNLSRRRFST